MHISAAWSEGEALFFLRGHFPFLKRYKDAVFEGVDGRVLLGITDANARRIFGEQLAERDLGLLLAKLNFFRSSSLGPDELPASPPAAAAAPAAVVAAAGLPSVEPFLEAAACEEGWARGSDCGDELESGQGRAMRAHEAAVLVEVWDAEERFMGEAWLPELDVLAAKHAPEPTEHKLQLRRTFSKAEVARAPLIAPKPFLFGALKIRARYSRNCVISDCKQEAAGGVLYLTVLECLMYRGGTGASGVGPSLKFRLHVLPPTLVSDKLRQVFESRTSEATNSLCVWDEDLELRFLGVQDWTRKLQLLPSDTAAPAPAAAGRPAGETARLEELRQWATAGEWFMFHPRYSRYDAAVFPIHERTAGADDEALVLRTPEEARSLRKSPSFMTRFKEAVSLVLLSWGFSLDWVASASASASSTGGQRQLQSGAEGAASGKRWMDHSWRFRHVLLSCVVLEFRQGVKTLLEIYTTLVRRRRLNVEENGEGEAVFTLGQEEGARWFREQRRSSAAAAAASGQSSTWPRRHQSVEELAKLARLTT